MTTRYDNMSDKELADEYGELNARTAGIDARQKEIKGELILRNARYTEGGKFTVTISEETRKTLDTKALRAALGDDICAEYEKASSSTVLRVKATAVFVETV